MSDFAYCPQCSGEFEFGTPDEFLLGDTVFCSEECADEWLAERSDGDDEQKERGFV
jgi:hypothetical protein